MRGLISFGGDDCCAPLHEECSKHHRHKENPGVKRGICGVGSDRVQVMPMWVTTPGIGNGSHQRRLGVTKLRL